MKLFTVSLFSMIVGCSNSSDVQDQNSQEQSGASTVVETVQTSNVVQGEATPNATTSTATSADATSQQPTQTTCVDGSAPVDGTCPQANSTQASH